MRFEFVCQFAYNGGTVDIGDLYKILDDNFHISTKDLSICPKAIHL